MRTISTSILPNGKAATKPMGCARDDRAGADDRAEARTAEGQDRRTRAAAAPTSSGSRPLTDRGHGAVADRYFQPVAVIVLPGGQGKRPSLRNHTVCVVR